MPFFALTIFLGAFLLFQVQPLMGKFILPWFGGGPGVWTTCMLFFQVLLLGGYAYAHLSSARLKPRAQAFVHVALLVGALLLLPILPSDSWKPADSSQPALRILLLLTAVIGLPYFVLSSTGPLLQRWVTLTFPGKVPYRLFALSNAGSLLALVSYPFYFETHFSRQTQATIWGWSLGAYALCCARCALQVLKTSSMDAPVPESAADAAEGTPEPDPGPMGRMLWLLLPACASVLLLAVTNKLCQDVAVIPFLWIVPLGLYLLSFIICFDNPRWYARFPFTLALIAAAGATCWALWHSSDWSVWKQIAVYCCGLFVFCMVCHGELYRLRPPARQLTGYYLMIAAGGALGGVFVAVICPLIFKDFYELHLGLILCAVLYLVVCVKDWVPQSEKALEASARLWRWLACTLPLGIFAGLDWWIARIGQQARHVPKGWFLGLRIGVWVLLALLVISWVGRGKFKAFRHWRFLACVWLALGVAALGRTLWIHGRKTDSEIVQVSRNFYGVLTVFERLKNDPFEHYYLLEHGRITHGLQFVDEAMATWPTSYYGLETGIGLGIKALPASSRRIGVVGLGTASLAVYGRPGDFFRVYEINPEVQRLAHSPFTYLDICKARIEVVLGDARLSLEREPPQSFDLLALDAFSSDSIPVHLLTREAFALYQRHLKPDGIIAVHVSNHYLDLEPVVAKLAQESGFKLATIDYDESDETWWLYSSTWMLLSRNAAVTGLPSIAGASRPAHTNSAPLWTDDFVSLFPILK